MRILSLTIALCCLVALTGCDAFVATPESRVEKTEVEITRALANAKKLGAELAKAERAIADEKAKLADLIGKLNGLIHVPSPKPVEPAVPVTPVVPEPAKPVSPVVPVVPPKPAVDTFEPADGQFGVAKRIYAMAKTIKTDNLSSEAAAFAANFRTVAGLIKAGKTDSMIAEKQGYNISIELTKLNKPLTTSHPAWLPSAVVLGKTISDLFNADRISNNADWEALMIEIADALESVSRAVK